MTEFMDAALFSTLALAFRRRVVPRMMPEVLKMLRREACMGQFEALVKLERFEAWRAVIFMEEIADQLARLGFVTKTILVRDDDCSGERPALHVNWRMGRGGA